jgi:NADPH-dependent FMN reductase
MSRLLHFAGLSGSLRKDSYNTKLLRATTELLPEAVTMEILSVSDIPLYNADLDFPAASIRPTAVQNFRDALTKADGLVIAISILKDNNNWSQLFLLVFPMRIIVMLTDLLIYMMANLFAKNGYLKKESKK